MSVFYWLYNLFTISAWREEIETLLLSEGRSRREALLAEYKDAYPTSRIRLMNLGYWNSYEDKYVTETEFMDTYIVPIRAQKYTEYVCTIIESNIQPILGPRTKKKRNMKKGEK